MPLRLSIDDEDIAEIAELLGVSFDDENRHSALRATDSCDVQACPGSGKTTLLVAKLAILVRKWTWKDQGICVLSHTNAARHEVEHRLAGFASSHRLLGYPHFVGTIQAFVDRFLALPSLRELGLETTMVDNERSAEKAEELLEKCYAARAFLGRRRNGIEIVRGLRVQGPNLTLGSSGGTIPCGRDSKTFKDLQRLKGWLLKDGLFRYDDMYAFAERYLSCHGWIVAAVRRRFPWVFIDEMQDTDALQDKLLDFLFGSGCILQRFGDSNQAIFRGAEITAQTSFPKPGYLGLPDSKRFGQQIAGFATPLTQAASPQELTGSHADEARRHTIFVFDSETITNVLPAYGDLLALEFTKGLPDDFVATAIGFRKTPPTDAEADKLPFSIGHYHSGFDTRMALKSDRPNHLIGFVRKARHVRSVTGECAEASGLVFDGVVELLRLVDARDADGRRITKTKLLEELRNDESVTLAKFKTLCAGWILREGVKNAGEWAGSLGTLCSLCGLWLPDELPPSANAFLEWTDPPGTACGDMLKGERLNVNIFCHESQIGPIDIQLGTIHSVKGQTHTTTLVLETFDRAHDLKKVLKILSGGAAGKSPPVKHMKRVFVAMTRPRELVCLAIHKDHLPPANTASLAEQGWRFHDLAGRS